MIVGMEDTKCGMKRIRIQNNENEILTESGVNMNFQVLRSELMDLQFIVSHLREDIWLSIENGRSILKAEIKSEIGLLVYSLMEESIREQLSLKEELKMIQEENEVLLENEGAIMEEMTKLSLENDTLKNKNSRNESEFFYTDAIKKLKETLLETESEVDDLETIMKSTFKECLRDFDDKSRLLKDEICNLKLERDQLRVNNEKFKSVHEELKRAVNENEVKIAELLESQNESELRMRELLTVNFELMDLSESAKKKDDARESELEILKKTVTAQKIELERTKETLARERKISSLKISDLREQLSERENKVDNVNKF